MRSLCGRAVGIKRDPLSPRLRQWLEVVKNKIPLSGVAGFSWLGCPSLKSGSSGNARSFHSGAVVQGVWG